jgi:hypothetical protein
MIDDDDLRTRLREPLRRISAPAPNLEPALRRGRRLRTRWTIATAFATAVLVAAVAVPLVVLSGVGHRQPAPVHPGGAVSAFPAAGLSIQLPEGWDSRLDRNPDASGPILQFANRPLEPLGSVDDDLLTKTRAELGPDQVAVVLMEVTNDCPCAGFAPTELPIAVDPQPCPCSEVEGVADTHSFARRLFVVGGRWFDLRVDFGGHPPVSSLVAELNGVLATLQIAAAELPATSPGWVTHVDLQDKLSIDTPQAWGFHTDPVPALIEPPIVFAAGTERPIPQGGDCGPDNALNGLPADGVLLWLTEFRRPQSFADFRPRPASFDLEGEPQMLECAGAPQYFDRFVDGWRYFQFNVAFGPDAPAGLRQDAIDTMNSLVLGQQSQDEVEQRYVYICDNYLTGGWIYCPLADWVRSTISNAGFQVHGTREVSIVGAADGNEFDMWTSPIPKPDGTWPRLPQVADVDGVPVYGDDSGVSWRRDKIVVWVGMDPNDPLTSEQIDALVRASTATPFDSG